MHNARGAKTRGSAWRLFAGMGVAGIIGLAGCSGGAGGGAAASSPEERSPAQVVEASYDATTRARSAKFAMTVAGPGDAFSVRAQGAMGFEPQQMVMRMAMPDGSMTVVRSTQDHMWMKIPKTAPGRLPGNKTWLEFDLKKMSKQALGGSLAQLQSQDPAQTLAFLRSIEKVTESGHAVVRGVDTTKYRVLVDLKKLAEESGKADRAALRRFRQLSADDTLPTTVWLDAKDRIRRMRMAMDFENPNNGRQVSMKITMDIFAFGSPVDVEAPPKQKTISFTELNPN